MASVCHPSAWEKLKDFDVTMWHAMSGDRTEKFVEEIDPGEIVVHGGSCVGLVAIHLNGVRGYYHFDLHGYDGSYKDGIRHAGPHKGHSHGFIDTKIWGNWYKTSRMMENSNTELQNTVQIFPIFCVFHGEGRNQKFAELANLPNVANYGTDKEISVRNGKLVTT
jgi:hypothetical protein